MGQGSVTDEERLWAMLLHLLALLGWIVWLGAFIAPLVVYLVYRDKSKFVAFHALQSLFFQLALFGCMVVCILLAVLLTVTIVFACWAVALTFFVVGGIAVGGLAYVTIAAIKAYDGEVFEYWLVGQWAHQIVGI